MPTTAHEPIDDIKPLLVGAERQRELKEETVHLPSWDLHSRQIWDVELLLNGAFSPLEGYLTREESRTVRHEMRLPDGRLWPMPINLDVTEEFAQALSPGDRVALRHPEGMVLAVLTVRDIWRPDLEADSRAVFGSARQDHPGVRQWMRSNPVYLGGKLDGLELPTHHTFRHLRHTPTELRSEFVRLGWKRIVAFHTRNPLHRAQVELTRRAAHAVHAHLLIHPVVGRTGPGDIDSVTCVRCYQAALPHYPPSSTALSLLPLAMRMAGPREALWHALIRKNYGCTHFIVGRDHAGPRDADGNRFYNPQDAHELARQHVGETGIEIVPFEEMVYCEDRGEYMSRTEVPQGGRLLDLTGTELRRRIQAGSEVPAWFSYPEVVDELRRRYPTRSRQGYTVFFTGLSGAGKSTIANVLVAKLMELDTRPVTLLDGDIVRKNLSSELGFSKEHRDLNIKRIGFVASEITKNGGVAICAPIAPYAATRNDVRSAITQHGGFIEVHVATSLDVCEQRDRKGLYAQARAGRIKGFTGIDDPYEEPENAELRIDTTLVGAEEAAERVVMYLTKEGFITSMAPGGVS